MREVTVPEGWSLKTINEICNIAIGGTPSRSVAEYWDTEKTSNNLWVSIKDLNTSWITETSEYITDLGIKKSNVKLVKKGTVLMSFKLSVGRVAYAGKDLYTNEAIVAFLPKAKNLISNEFLYQGLQQWDLLENVDQAVKGVTLNKEKINLIKALLPPLPEQQKIAAILTSVDTVIEKTHAQINKLKHLKTAMMQELLTQGIGHTEFKDSPVGKIPKAWEVGKIADLGKVVTGNTPKTTDSSNYDGNIPFISPADLGDAVYIETTKSSITEKGLLETRELPKGSVCVVCIGSTIGKTGITTKLSATNQQINSIVCKNNHSEFVYYLLSHYSNKIKTEAGTQAVPIINKSSFSALQVQIPPFEEQIKIANTLSGIDLKITAINKKIKSLKNTKKALMQDLLSGKVRVLSDYNSNLTH